MKFKCFFNKITVSPSSEASAGLLLAAVALTAIGLANSPWADSWQNILDRNILYIPNNHLGTTRNFVGNALMVLFFFVVGLEVKREILIGNLSDPRQRRLPVLAALAGMAAPAAVYTAICWNQPGLHRGWAIPAATDIAFALGVMALLGSRVPRNLRLFLLTVAVVDDLGAVVVIALAYTTHLDGMWLTASVAVLAAMLGLNRCNCLRTWPYLALAVLLWWCVLHSGLHATVAGVMAALMVPLALDSDKDSPLLRLEHKLAPWSGLVIVPLFGLSHAGVRLNSEVFAGDLTLPLAIGLGLLLGKPLGVFGAIVLAEKSGFAPRPEGVSWLQALGAGQLAGIGFTMSMFIGTLAFPPDPWRENAIRMGILAGSLLACLLGAALLGLGRRNTAP